MTNHFSTAKKLLESHNYEAAAACYSEAIGIYPDLDKYFEFMRVFCMRKIQNKLSQNRYSSSTTIRSLNANVYPCKNNLFRFESDFHIDALKPAELDVIYSRYSICFDSPVMFDDLVSIIIPSYNNSAWIKRAINSALSQYGVNVEVIVVDDGSTDDSIRVAKEVGSGFECVRVISLLKNFGCYYARNIGITNSKGKYITIVDSDDIIPPGRILKQLSAIKSNPGSVASIGQLRRWSSDFSLPLNDLKHGENSLLWDRTIVNRIGYYDSVKFGGDSEFRLRVQRSFGLDKFIKIPDEIYFLRTVANSLTSDSGGSQAYVYENGKLFPSLSQSRKNYSDNFNEWQKRNKPISSLATSSMRMEFPLLRRPFDVGSVQQKASPSLNQKRIGGLASFPPREDALKACVNSILSQLDELHIYLNNYKIIPVFLNHPKIFITQSQTELGDLRDNGKFYALENIKDAYIFTLDDDLIYPDDYVSRMIHQIELFSRNVIVGVHGVIFPIGNFDKLQQRTVFHFKRSALGNFVDLLGTGTTAWHSSTIQMPLKNFQTQGVCDLWFARSAAIQGIPLYSIPRIQGWINEFGIFDISLYQEALNEPKKYFDIYNNFVAPVLSYGRVRYGMEMQLSSGFDSAVLQAAEIQLSMFGRNVNIERLNHQRSGFNIQSSMAGNLVKKSAGDIFFHIVVNGWNCIQYVDTCLRSIATQKPGNYSYSVTLVDDGSSDGTYQKLLSSTILPDAQLIRIDVNSGSAYARHVGIISNSNPNSIVVLLDMDDSLESDALYAVAQCYTLNSKCLMTIGNWIDQFDVVNKQPFYDADTIDRQNVRSFEMFNATHLRTFRYQLYNAIEEDDLKFKDGCWLETCTDVALMFPLLDQCYADEIEFISKPIYRYNKMHANGTLARFGKQHKIDRLEWLKSKKPKSRFRLRE